MRQKSVFIVGLASGIGASIARQYLHDGWMVMGTYRSGLDRERIVDGVRSYWLDVSDPDSIQQLSIKLAALDYKWDVFICSVGTLEPIGSFLSIDFDNWRASFDANYFGQLNALHKLHCFHNTGAIAVFFTGGAPNGVLPNFSAYSVAKIALTKMIEYLDAEDDDAKYVIIGPGWVDTKIHEQTLQAGDAAGSNFDRTRDFISGGNVSTPISDIYDCINWLIDQPKSLIGGRNFSVVWDSWGHRKGNAELVGFLTNEDNLFKLRRKEVSD